VPSRKPAANKRRPARTSSKALQRTGPGRIRLPGGTQASDSWPCLYERHRPYDWRLKAGHPLLPPDTPGRIVCGVCHPPPFPPEEIQRRASYPGDTT
jgi:hypothetical protein